MINGDQKTETERLRARLSEASVTIEDLGADRYRLHLDNGHDLAQPCRDTYCHPKGCPGLNKCGRLLWKRRR